MDDLPPYFVDFSGFLDDCVELWRAAADGLPPLDASFDVIRRVRITEYWLVKASCLACSAAHATPTDVRSVQAFDRLTLEVEAHLEAFYLSAFQLQEEVEYMARKGVRVGRFKADGITRARNRLIVHQQDQGNTPQSSSIAVSGNGDVRFRFGWSGTNEPSWRDPGLHANAEELRSVFQSAFLQPRN